MRLIRLATAHFSPDPKTYRCFEMTVGRVKVSGRLTNRVDATDTDKKMEGPSRLLQAEIDLAKVPSAESDGLIDIPETERRACEAAIETVANTISVLERCQRRLATPWPPVAFLPDSEDERNRLSSVRGIRYSMPSKVSAHAVIEPEAPLLQGLLDRLDGLQALATLLSQPHPLGRYREAIRFFEIAFARPITALDKKLAQFLASGCFGYTRDEVARWIEPRHGSVHGDRMPVPEIVWDADVAPFMDRIEQAVYDALFNKKDWRNPSHARRELWRPISGTDDPNGSLFMTQGHGGVISMQVFDGFGAYPHDLSANLRSLPAEWWYRFPDLKRPLADGDLSLSTSS